MSALSEMPVVTVEQVHRFRQSALSEVKRLQGVMNQAILLVNPNRIEEATADDLLLQLGMMLDEMEELRKAPEVIDQLIVEQDELKAHCEGLKSLLEAHTGRDDNSDGMLTTIYPFDVAALLEEYPAQSLAEFEIKAIERFVALYGRARGIMSIEEIAKQAIESLRTQAKGK